MDSVSFTDIERELIADIARIAAIAPTVPSTYLSRCEYESRGGRFTREQIRRLGLWTRYHAAARAPGPRYHGGRDTAQRDTALADAAQKIIDDILRVCRRHGWPPRARPSFKEYRRLGGRHPIVNVRRAGGWLALCARAELCTPRAQLEQATVDLATIVADARRVARSLGRGDGATLTSIEYRRLGGRYYDAARTRPGGWAAICAAAGLALPRHKTQKHRPRRQWQKSSGVWCGPAELTTTEATGAGDPSTLPAEPAAALNLPPTAGQLFLRGTFDPNFWRKRQIRHKQDYYRARLVAMATQAANR